MKIREIVKVLDAEVCYGEELMDVDCNSACASDMMSDVLAFLKDQALLVSGLCNPQVVRTADMMDIKCIALVRGKKPTEDMLKLAREKKIAVLSSKMRMYIACGKLYESGLKAGEISV